jgi:PPOX class probable F420-dependent enzyme
MPNQRTSIVLTPEEQDALLAERLSLQVASNGPGGFPHLVAMWFAVIDGKINFTTFGKSQKVLNLKRDPRVSAMLESGLAYNELKGLVVEGEAEIIDTLDECLSVMGRVNEKYIGPQGEPSEGARKMAAKRVVVRIHPGRVRSWDHSKLG